MFCRPPRHGKCAGIAACRVGAAFCTIVYPDQMSVPRCPLFWPTDFVTSLINTPVNRFIPTTVPQYIPAELEHMPWDHSE